MIPSQWSDFEFWRSLWDAKKEALMLLLRNPLLPPDAAVFFASMKVLFGALFSSVLYCVLSHTLWNQGRKGR
jgi:hypothetical protein